MPEPIGQIDTEVEKTPTVRKPQVHEGVTEDKKRLREWHGRVDSLMDSKLKKLYDNRAEDRPNTETIKRQRQILKSLPPNIVEELAAHLKAQYIEQSKFSKVESGLAYDKKILSGEIFERLIEAEDDLFHLDPNGEDHPQTEEQEEIASKILELMANPERFDIQAFSVRQPDWLRIYFQEGVFIIDASLEAKKHLDQRTLDQLRSFRKNFEQIVEKINHLEDADKHGLEGLGIGNHQIKVSESYYQIIAVPRSAQLIDLPERKTPFISAIMPSNERQALIDIINDSSKTTIVRASFSHNELEVLTEFFLEEVENKIAQESLYKKLDHDAEMVSE